MRQHRREAPAPAGDAQGGDVSLYAAQTEAETPPNGTASAGHFSDSAMAVESDASLHATVYPRGMVRTLLNTTLVTPPTRAVLEERLRLFAEIAATSPIPQFFTGDEFATLTTVCTRLLGIAQDGTVSALEVAVGVDNRLAEGKTNGWRYDSLPADGDAYRLALNWLDAAARGRFGVEMFAGATAAQQEMLLCVLREGTVISESDPGLPPTAAKLFEEILAEVVEIYYSHPLAQEEIGFTGMADGHGWKHIALNDLEAWEPRPNTPYQLPESIPVLPEPSPLTPAAQLILLPGVSAPPRRPVVPPSAPARGAAAAARGRNVAANGPMTPVPVDVVVIGTGAGGAPVLARLAQAGISVVALEAGRFWEPVRDFATDERVQDKLSWNDERLSAGADPLHFGINNSGIGVGGTTLHYTAYTPRPHPDDFHLRRDFGVGADWPLTYGDLELYLTEVEQFLGVSGPIPYPWGGHRTSGYPLSPLPLNGAARLMQRGCAELGLRTSPAPNAALSGPFYVEGVGMRKACTNRGFCQSGCSVGAKASMDVTYVPLALAHGADVRSDCFVTRIERDRTTGSVIAVVYIQSDGREVRQYCRAVFLCAGAIETPRLLLMNGIGNGNGQVGRNFMAHTGLQIWGQAEEDVRPFKGIPGGLICEDTHRPADADFAGGYLIQSLGVLPVNYASQFARTTRTFGRAMREHMIGYNHVAGINICGEGLPSDRNYLELSEEKDARGLPKPRIHFTVGANERSLSAHADRLLRQIWDAAGVRNRVWAFPRYAHTLGTCRMGTDPETSVVNPDGRVHEVPNLFVCDTSIFPSSLSVNPALTQMALSLRIADRFIEAFRRGDIG